MKITLSLTLLIALAAAFAAAIPRAAEKPSHQAHRFTALGDLAGGSFNSAPYGISADGSVVIGIGNSATGMEAFRWTRYGGMVGLGFQQAWGVSADGSTVVGFRLIAGESEPVRWTQQGGLQSLRNLPGYVYGEAHGASADGSVIVGRCEPPLGRAQMPFGMPFRWTPIGGLARLAQLPSAAVAADAHAVSAEGEVVVGAIEYDVGRCEAFRWTSQQSGFVDLGFLPGDTGSTAHAVSADGSVVVGISQASARAFRWTQKTGMVGLGTLPGGSSSCAFGVSADGSIIVGQGDGEFGLEAFVWDANHGMRSLRELLMNETDLDTSLRGWKLRSAMAVSGDGSVIVGFGINPDGNREAWIARLSDKPSTEAPALRIATR